ncbi:MAG: hypothetical protein EPN47_00765 [Acidobacteria bacterium]|nr:MAG: hypothetical protein EPN47_00765 [Acidobacteriota bacterium]
MAFRLIPEPDLTPEELQQHIFSTYINIRVGIAVIGIAFPFLLWLGGRLYARLPLQPSMSAYYHAMGFDSRSMRDWFVGLLFVEGIFLYLYKGFGRAENWALNIAGLLAVGVAIFPEAASPSWITLHGLCAVGLFLCIAFVALFCADNTLDLIKDTDMRNPAKVIAHLKLAYKLIGWAMIASMVVAYALNTVMKTEFRTFWVEAAGILFFGAYWLLKGLELRKTAADLKALRGLTRTSGGKLMSLTAHGPRHGP